MGTNYWRTPNSACMTRVQPICAHIPAEASRLVRQGFDGGHLVPCRSAARRSARAKHTIEFKAPSVVFVVLVSLLCSVAYAPVDAPRGLQFSWLVRGQSQSSKELEYRLGVFSRTEKKMVF
ncbi:hypothetical protein BRADI_4g14933v3 [Brachypodium distachyon]|uniref:Uncharacterized protein n=1 Tax=Brachypodium distachyon TaxID=15368 RepID=A0A2K2CMX4_BRADI|nr:hypothetical protein BRADI_4g14933v3 [Brachypodium distachyon]